MTKAVLRIRRDTRVGELTIALLAVAIEPLAVCFVPINWPVGRAMTRARVMGIPDRVPVGYSFCITAR